MSTLRWFFYLARCSDGSLYAGTCRDLDRRVAEHNVGTGAKYTRSRQPVHLVYSEQHKTKHAALRRESEVKKWTKMRKEDLTRGMIANALVGS